MEISNTALAGVLAHAREALPNECCGLLLGSPGRIETALRARNLEESPTRFLIDPLDHFTAIRMARLNGRAVLGVYHSHPNGPEHPSPRDAAEATYKEYVYLIVVPGNAATEGPAPRIRAFRLDAGNFSEVPLVTVGE